MKIWRRIRLFALGLGMGVVLVFLFFKDRTSVLSSWTPNSRVLLEAEAKGIFDTPAWKCFASCAEVPDNESFLESGDVQFSNSKTQSNPRVYTITFELTKDRFVQGNIAIGDTTADILSLNGLGFDLFCDC